MIILEKLPIKLIGYRLLVELQDVRDKTDIKIPDGAGTERTLGKVVMVGDGSLPPTCRVDVYPPPAALGDLIVMQDYGGGEVMIDNVAHRIISGDDVLAILDPVPAPAQANPAFVPPVASEPQPA